MAVSTLELLKNELFYKGPDGKDLGRTPRKLAEIYNILGGEIEFAESFQDLKLIYSLRDHVEKMCPDNECWEKFYSWFSSDQKRIEQVKLKDRLDGAMLETRRWEMVKRLIILSKPSENPDPPENLELNYP